MRGAFPLLASLAVVLGTAAPAQAWGSLTHTLVGERAFAMLAPRHPWLAPHRDAFLWGAIAGDLDRAPGVAEGPGRTHAASTVKALWREATASKDARARAFVLGWAVHVASDKSAEALREPSRRVALTRVLGAGADLDAAGEWAADAALSPRAATALVSLYRSTVLNAITPDGAPVRAVLGRVLGTDEAAYMAWARLQAGFCVGGLDGYLANTARFHRLTPWAEAMRGPAVRHGIGALAPLLTQAVNRGVASAEALLSPAPVTE